MPSPLDKAMHHARMGEITPFRNIIDEAISAHCAAEEYSGEPIDISYIDKIFGMLLNEDLLYDGEIVDSFEEYYSNIANGINKLSLRVLLSFAKEDFRSFGNLSNLFKKAFCKHPDFHVAIDEVSAQLTSACITEDRLDHLTKHFPLHPEYVYDLINEHNLSIEKCVKALQAENRLVAYTGRSNWENSELYKRAKILSAKMPAIDHQVIYDARAYITLALELYDKCKRSSSLLMDQVIGSHLLKHSNFELTDLIHDMPMEDFRIYSEFIKKHEDNLLDAIKSLSEPIPNNMVCMPSHPSILSLSGSSIKNVANISLISVENAVTLHELGATRIAKEIYILSSSSLARTDSIHQASLVFGEFSDDDLHAIFNSRRVGQNEGRREQYQNYNIGAFMYYAYQAGTILPWNGTPYVGGIYLTFADELMHIGRAIKFAKDKSNHIVESEWWIEQIDNAISTLPEDQRSVSELKRVARCFNISEIYQTMAYKRSKISGDLSL